MEILTINFSVLFMLNNYNSNQTNKLAFLTKVKGFLAF